MLRRVLMLLVGVGGCYLAATVLLAPHLSAMLTVLLPPPNAAHPARIISWGQLVALALAVPEHLPVALHDPLWRRPDVAGGLACLVICPVLVLLAARPPSAQQRQAREQERVRDQRKQEKAREQAPRVASVEELRSEGWLDGAGWPVGRDTVSGRDLSIPRARQAEHVLVLGGTGSGKTSRALLRWLFAEADLPPERRASLLVFDPKAGGEITDTTIGYLRSRGYAVYVYDPTAHGTLRCNVLAACHSAAAVRAVVSQWIDCTGASSDFWRDMSISLLTGALLYLRAQAGDGGASVTFADAARLYRDQPFEEVLARVQEAGTREDAPAGLKEAAGLLRSLALTKVTLGGALTGLRPRLAALSDPAVVASMSGHDVTPEFWREFVATPSVLYVPVPLEDASALRPLLVTFLSLCVTQLDRVAGKGAVPLSRPVRLVIDEFANLGRISGLARIISTARFRDIGLALATQSPTAIRRVYGGDADTLQDNLLTHIVLSKSRADALKRYAIAALHVDLPLLMEKDTALVQRAGDLPVRVKTRGWFKDRSLRKAVQAARAQLDKQKTLDHQAQVLGLPPAAAGPQGGAGGGAWIGGGDAPLEPALREYGSGDDADGEEEVPGESQEDGEEWADGGMVLLSPDEEAALAAW